MLGDDSDETHLPGETEEQTEPEDQHNIDEPMADEIGEIGADGEEEVMSSYWGLKVSNTLSQLSFFKQ